jgi:ABC-type branched-subunit amino acid transport system substrate-binding protein
LRALRARGLAATDAHAAAARAWLELYGQASEALDLQMIRERLADSLEKIQDPVLLSSLRDDFLLSRIGDEVLWRLNRLLISSKRDEEARAALDELSTRFPSSKYITLAQEGLRGSGGDVEVNTRRLGALLPLSGARVRDGRKALQSLQLQLGIYRPEDDKPGARKSTEATEDWELIVEDAGESEASTLAALEKLAQSEKVAAVVGPVSSKGIEAVGKRADELGIPLISLAQLPIASGGWSVNAGKTSISQTREIARYAIQELKMARFAIVHPRDKFGEQYAGLFWDAVEEFGGEIRGIESYAPTETDFRSTVEKLVGLSWPEARSREVNALARQRAQMNITKRTMKTEKFFALPPIVDFDAVFIADEPKITAQLIPTFAYRDVEGVRFLGTSLWNSPHLIARAAYQVVGALFPDVFHFGGAAAESQTTATKFRQDYRTTFHQEPDSGDALSYDAGGLIKNVLRSLPETASRSEIRDQLRKLENFPGAAGRIAIGPDGSLQRKLQIIEIKDGKFTVVR